MSGGSTLRIVRRVFEPLRYKLLLGLGWLVVLTAYLWLPQMNLFSYILTQAPLSGAEKVEFFLTYYPRVLSEIMSPIILSLVIFSFLTAVSIVLLVYMFRSGRRQHSSQATELPAKAYAATAGSAFGSHLLSCGGTLLLASVFPAFAGSTAIMGGNGAVINTWLATGANLAGILIVLYVIRKICRDIAAMSAIRGYQPVTSNALRGGYDHGS